MHLPTINVPLAPRGLAPLVVLGCLLLAGGALKLTFERLQINTDTADMISSELPFRAAYERYRDEFPAHVDMLVAVVDGPTPEAAELAALELAAALKRRDDLYEEVFLPGTGPWFEEQALLWNDLEELEELAERLIRVQPFIGMLSNDPGLAGFSRTLEQALAELDPSERAELALLLGGFSQALAAELAGEPFTLSWQELLLGEPTSPDERRRYLFIKPTLDFGELFPAEPGIRYLRQAVAELALPDGHGISVRITGDAALGYEELESASSGAERAGIMALLMVTVILWLAMRSLWLVVATLITLLTGLVLTAGFATLAIGQLNLISIAFAVLYIGLAVDYGIHLCLRYRELLARGLMKAQALQAAVSDIAGSLTLCAVSTAAAFYAFLPTAFTGVSELGLISGTGMFINLGLSLFFLPSLLLLLPAPPPQQRIADNPVLHRLSQLPLHSDRLIRRAALALAGIALLLLPQLSFDRNPLNLRDADSESVATLQALMRESPTPPMNITVIARNAAEAARLAEELRQLAVVRDVVTLADILPAITDEKLQLIEELGILLESSLQPGPATASPGAANAASALANLERRLQAQLALRDQMAPELETASRRLSELLSELESASEAEQTQRLARLEQSLLAYLPMNLARLSNALAAPWTAGEPPPAALRARWENQSGLQRVAVYAAEDINDNQALRRFVEDVQAIAPEATDEPVLSLRAGDAVVAAFIQAFSLALLMVTVILLLVLRSLRPTALVLMPLLLAAVLTGAAMTLAQVPFNFANVIALPLLLGIGVDSGIHMVARASRDPAMRRHPLASSTARAVLFSGLTTVCSFGNLLLSSHPGTASMGLVLSAGTAITLACMLIVLPALIAAPWAWRQEPP